MSRLPPHPYSSKKAHFPHAGLPILLPTSMLPAPTLPSNPTVCKPTRPNPLCSSLAVYGCCCIRKSRPYLHSSFNASTAAPEAPAAIAGPRCLPSAPAPQHGCRARLRCPRRRSSRHHRCRPPPLAQPRQKRLRRRLIRRRRHRIRRRRRCWPPTPAPRRRGRLHLSSPHIRRRLRQPPPLSSGLPLPAPG